MYKNQHRWRSRVY